MAGLADILSRLQAGEIPAREPMAPFYGPGDTILERRPGDGERPKDNAPAWYRAIQPYPVNVPAAVEGLLTAEGLGPAVQGAKSLAGLLGQAAGSPVGKAVLAGGAGLALTPTDANPQSPDNLGRLLQQQDALMKQREKAAIEREGQAKTGRGPKHGAATEELTRIDDQLRELSGLIRDEQRRVAEAERFRQKREADEAFRNSPEGKLQAERLKKEADIAEEKRQRGLPTREKWPSWAQDFVIPAAAIAGTGITYGLTRRANNQYNGAVQKFMEAQTRGDVPGMALAQGAIQALENPGFVSKASKITAAGLPAEVRMYELYNDMKKDPESRAYKEAMAKVHDPWALGTDVGGALASSLIAYGLGSKSAPLKDPMGAAIARENPYEGAKKLSDGLSSALRDGENIRPLLPSQPAGAPPQGSLPGTGETPRPSLLSRILGTLSGKGSSQPTQGPAGPSSGQNQPLALPSPAPQPATSPSLTTSDVLKNLPGMKAANNPTLPDHLTMDSRLGGSKIRDKSTGRIVSDPDKQP